MCLYAEQYETKRLYKKLQKRGTITCYKVLKRCSGKCYSTVYSTGIPWKVGVKKADTMPYEVYKGGDLEHGTYEHGIHVYLTKKMAKENAYGWSASPVVIPVKCDIKDFIAANVDEAVFSKVTVEKLP